jgi:SSS family solute:Na+ symporter
MAPIDWWVIGGYFALLLGLAWWVIRQSIDTTDDYFLAGRHLGWFVVGASIFASNIGSEHVVGLAGQGAVDGVKWAHYELHAWCLLVLGWVLVPFYIRSQVFTMPEFLEKRFSPSARWLLSVISLVAYVITKIAVGIFAGGIVFSTLLPDWGFQVGSWDIDSFWIGSIAVIVLTGTYTILGGLRAVAYTEALQTIILVVGSALVTYFGLNALGGSLGGGWSALRETLGSEAFNLWNSVQPEGVAGTWSPVEIKDANGNITEQAFYFSSEGHFPWIGMLFCAPIIGLWYWCTDQYIVQRALGARNEQQARRGSIFASMLKLLPVFIFIIPGMICIALAQKGEVQGLESLVDESGQVVAAEAQSAFPLLVTTVLPDGVRGIVVAGLLAALMSSLAGVFNASSTLFTMDFYSKFNPKASQHHLVWVGRVATAAMVLVGLAWIPVIQGSRGLYEYLQGVQSYLAPPIFAVFFLGVFWKRLNGAGCMAARVIGFAMCVFRLAVDTPVSLGMEDYENGYAEGSFLWIINRTYFQYYSLLILAVSSLAMVAVSYMTSAPSDEQISGLTFGSLTEEHRRESRSSWSSVDVLASAAVLAAIVAAYIYFQG